MTAPQQQPEVQRDSGAEEAPETAPTPNSAEAPGAGEAPETAPAQDTPAKGVPAGEPEAPVGPTAPPDQPEEPDDHEQKLEQDLDELTAKAQKADEYLELAQRTKADFENYRRRASREAAAAQERGVAKLAKELLPAVDNLDRALAAAKAGTEAPNGNLADGIKLVHADVIAA